MLCKAEQIHKMTTIITLFIQDNFKCNVKFGHSEQATKFEKIFHLEFDVTE